MKKFFSSLGLVVLALGGPDVFSVRPCAAMTFNNKPVFDAVFSAPPEEQRGADTQIRVDSGGTLWVHSASILRYPAYTKGANLWRSTDHGNTWVFLGNGNVFPPEVIEGDFEFDASERLYLVDPQLPPNQNITWLYEDPYAITQRSTDYSERAFTPTADRPWLSFDGNRVLLTTLEGLIYPFIRIAEDPGSGPILYSPPIPMATDPALLALLPPVPDPGISGLTHGRLMVNPVTGRFCAPLVVVNGSIGDYMPAHALWTACSSDGGLTWENRPIFTASTDVFIPPFWPMSAMDEAGNLYVAFAANMDSSYNATNSFNIFLTASTNGGVTWSPPAKVNTRSGTNVMPAVIAGCAGGVDVVWYGANMSGNPQLFPNTAEWNVYLAQTKNATGAAPTFAEHQVSDHVVHIGAVNLKGAPGTADWRLLQFPGVALDANGKAQVVWTDTGTDPFAADPLALPNNQHAGNLGRVFFARQLSGSTLESCF